MPLLGSYGGSSEYAYRGTLDDLPDDFLFINQSDAIPGEIFTSNEVTITGINNRALVRVSAGASVSINGGSYVIPTEESPVFITENQTLSVRIPSTSGQISDFNKLYVANVSVGRKTTSWEVRTKTVDVDPEPFTFINQTNREIGVGYTSNEVLISGLEPGFEFLASITSGSGQIIRNGVEPGIPSLNVSNGDRIYLRLISPFEYSNFPTGSGTRTNTTTVNVGSYSTSWSVSSRDVDLFVDPFDFNDVNNALINSVYTAQSVNTLGVVTTITGADQGIPLVGAVSGCELRVEQPSASGVGFVVRRDFSTQNATVFNGDRLTVRITTGSNFSETKVGIVTVSSFAGKFIVTTRPRPIDTIPDAFTFTDLIEQTRGSTVESNEITLTGMSDFGDEGTASITTGTNGGNAQYQVSRNGSIVRPFGTSTFKVRNGDKIKLKLTASSDSNITRSATFRVDGIDTNTIITGQSGFRDDVWSVTSAVRNCDITPFTLATRNNANPNTVERISFIVDGFQSDCRMVVSTSGGGSSLSVSGSSATNNIEVLPGTLVTLSMPSGDFSASKTATVTVSNSSTATTPTRTYTTTWVVNTVPDNRATSVTLTANPTLVEIGKPVTLTWTSVNAATVTGRSGDGFFPQSVSDTATVFPTVSQTYSISVQGPPSAANFPTSVSSSTFITILEDKDPDSFSFSPSSFSNQNKNAEVSSLAVSSLNSSVSVSGLTEGVTVNASVSSPTGSSVSMSVNGGGRVSSASVKNGDTIRVFLTNGSNADQLVTATLSIGGRTSSFSSRTTACTVPTSQRFYAGGQVTVNFKAAKVNGSQDLNLYTSKSGGFAQAKAGTSGASATIGGSPTTIPGGVTSVTVALVGGGGGGGPNKGGGAGGYVFATVPVSGGQSVNISIGQQGSFPGQFGNPSVFNVNGSPVVTASGGSSGAAGGAGGGGSAGPGISVSVEPGGSGSGKTGGTVSGGGSAGIPESGSKGGGASGGGRSLSVSNGTILSSATNGQPSSPKTGSTGLANVGSRGGGSGGSGLTGFTLSPPGTFAPSSRSSGGSGAAFYQSSPSPSVSWDQLIDTIVNQFFTTAGRPPSDSEMDTYTSQFTSNSGLTLDGLSTNIANSGVSRANFYTDSCGGTF